MDFVKGEECIELGDAEYTLTPSFETARIIESFPDGSVYGIIVRIAASNFKLKDIQMVVYGALRASGKDLSFEQVGKLVFNKGVGDLIGPVQRLCAAMAFGDESDSEAKSKSKSSSALSEDADSKKN